MGLRTPGDQPSASRIALRASRVSRRLRGRAIIGGAAGAGRGAESRLASIARLTFGHPRFTLIARPRNLRETLLARKAIREALG